ncbi:MAG: sigma-70 family RNA polymerase sigma factor [Elusimicrobiota bacterium]
MTEEEFLEKNARMVYNLSLRLMGNPVDAEDLAQDSLIRALKALPAFRGESMTTTWMYRITVNTWKNRVRTEKRRGLWKMLPLHLFFGDDSEDRDRERALPADEPPLDAGLESAETSAAVQKALMSLDDESRAVVVLREIEGFSYQQIAETLSIPEGTVKSRLSRARDALKRRLKSLAGAA